ncbi:hypothetical protein [Luteolibacter marinus]|uniref:hypothetical protein n=1 Tax=Luteolibacter marinus TaxID=2776705 RepID=UPI00186881F0|nr:hypothetical protein [Luteolibacter marinus]
MNPAPLKSPDGDEASALFARFLDQRLDDAGMQRLEQLLRDDPDARGRCAEQLLFEADLKDAVDPGELEWLETRQVVLGKKDGLPSLEIRRNQELRVGPRATPKAVEPPKPPALRRYLWLGGALAAAAAGWLWFRGPHPAAPVLKNPGFETTDLSLNPTGNTYALIEWQDYFSTPNAELCEPGRVTGGKIFAKSGRNVARLLTGGHLTQRLHDENGMPVPARSGARYVLSGWLHTDGTGPHVLRTALRVVASGRPAMIQYEAVHQKLDITPQPGWQPFLIEFNLPDDLQRTPSDVTVPERPLLDLEGRELTLSIDSRGHEGSVLYLDDLSLERNDP